VNPEDCLTQNC